MKRASKKSNGKANGNGKKPAIYFRPSVRIFEAIEEEQEAREGRDGHRLSLNAIVTELVRKGLGL